MIESQAIKQLKDILGECTESDEAVCYVTNVDAPVLKIAINALEKQIPKKPNKAIDRSWGIENEVNVCPVCDCYLTSVHFISIDENEVKGTDKVAYCETCGQKIDYNE